MLFASVGFFSASRFFSFSFFQLLVFSTTRQISGLLRELHKQDLSVTSPQMSPVNLPEGFRLTSRLRVFDIQVQTHAVSSTVTLNKSN